MLRHNDVFIIDIQEQGIEAKDKDILLESFEGLMCNTSSLGNIRKVSARTESEPLYMNPWKAYLRLGKYSPPFIKDL